MAILDAAADCGLPVEINGLGMSRPQNMTSGGLRYQYPYDEFWRMAASRSVKVICNADAHDPANVIKGAADAREYAAKLGITPLDTLF